MQLWTLWSTPPTHTHTQHTRTQAWLSIQTSPPTHITLAVMKQQPVSPEKDGYKRRCSRTDKEVLVSQIKTLNIRRHKRLFVLQLLFLPAALSPTRFTAFKFQQYCSNKGKYNEIFYADLLEPHSNKPSELKIQVCISEQQENVWMNVPHVIISVCPGARDSQSSSPVRSRVGRNPPGSRVTSCLPEELYSRDLLCMFKKLFVICHEIMMQRSHLH